MTGESLTNRAGLSLLKPGFPRGSRRAELFTTRSQAMRGRLDMRKNSGRTKF
jgi:hypothetical protein